MYYFNRNSQYVVVSNAAVFYTLPDAAVPLYQSHARTPKSSVLCVIVFGKNLCYQLMDGQLF